MDFYGTPHMLWTLKMRIGIFVINMNCLRGPQNSIGTFVAVCLCSCKKIK